MVCCSSFSRSFTIISCCWLVSLHCTTTTSVTVCSLSLFLQLRHTTFAHQRTVRLVARLRGLLRQQQQPHQQRPLKLSADLLDVVVVIWWRRRRRRWLRRPLFSSKWLSIFIGCWCWSRGSGRGRGGGCASPVGSIGSLWFAGR